MHKWMDVCTYRGSCITMYVRVYVPRTSAERYRSLKLVSRRCFHVHVGGSARWAPECHTEAPTICKFGHPISKACAQVIAGRKRNWVEAIKVFEDCRQKKTSLIAIFLLLIWLFSRQIRFSVGNFSHTSLTQTLQT